MNLQDEKLMPKYRCSQMELYAVCRLMWANCLEHIADFEQLKPYYTPAFINNSIAEVAAAEMLPDEDQRNSQSKTARANMDKKAARCLVNWQALKRYIVNAYKGNTTILNAKLNAAGAGYYRSASRGNWEDVAGLTSAALRFLGENTAELEAGNNMPAGFVALFATDAALFDTTYRLFMSKRQERKTGRHEKMEQNNLIFEQLMLMAKDGVHIYRYDAAIRNRFLWRKVKRLVTPERIKGLHG
jgi:hypothetical protein